MRPEESERLPGTQDLGHLSVRPASSQTPALAMALWRSHHGWTALGKVLVMAAPHQSDTGRAVQV